eukprot:scaffold307814_cov28-Tisochrysis_lutea.AAC.2
MWGERFRPKATKVRAIAQRRPTPLVVFAPALASMAPAPVPRDGPAGWRVLSVGAASKTRRPNSTWAGVPHLTVAFRDEIYTSPADDLDCGDAKQACAAVRTMLDT